MTIRKMLAFSQLYVTSFKLLAKGTVAAPPSADGRGGGRGELVDQRRRFLSKQRMEEVVKSLDSAGSKA